MTKRMGSIRFSDLMPLAWSALRRNKLRSFLTIGAIGFGVAVMMYLLSLGLGLEELTVGKVLQSNTLLSLKVSSFNREIKPLSAEAVTDMKALPNVVQVLPKLSVKGEAILTKRAPVTIVGVDSSYFEVNDRNPLASGKAYTEGETGTMLVSTAFLKLFGLDQGKTPLVTFSIELDKEYAPLATLKDIVVRGVVSDDQAVNIFLPREYLESKLVINKPDYEEVVVLVNSAESISTVSESIRGLGYRVSAVVETVDEIKKVFGVIQIVLSILGVIALIVASIGMFNTLTVSLLERTKEIGIMKALGMKRTDVRRLFITEALLIGALGGLGGIVFAYIMQKITIIAFEILATIAQGNVPELFINAWYLPVAAMAFSLAIALMTGIYPAQRAAKLSALSAIRYE